MRDRRYASLKAQRAGAAPHGGSGSRDPDSQIRIVVIFCLFRIPRDAFVHPAGPKGLVFYRNGHNRKATQPGKLNFFENKPLLALANFF